MLPLILEWDARVRECANLMQLTPLVQESRLPFEKLSSNHFRANPFTKVLHSADKHHEPSCGLYRNNT